MTKLSVNTPLVASIAALAVATIVTAAQLPDLIGAILTPGLNEDPTRQQLQNYLKEHREAMATFRDRFEGRSLFFKPKPPPKPRTPEQETLVKVPPKPPPSRPTGPPATYTGPSISFVLGEEVWFHDGLRLAVGEEDKGVKVISTNPPWSVKLGYSGGEYDVELFKRRFPGLKDQAPATRREVPGIKVVEKTALEPNR